jgi:hypothetical protein
MIELPDDKTFTLLPTSFSCPECSAPALYVEFDEWDDDGVPTELGTHVSCENEEVLPHWDMPYVDLMPLEERAHRWAARNVRIVESEAKTQARLRAWNAGEPIKAGPC